MSSHSNVANLPEPLRFGRAPASRIPGRIIVVSERLPIVLTREEGTRWRAAPARGALVSALAPVLSDRRGVWIGWPGVTVEELPGIRRVLAGAIQEGGYSLRPVALTGRDRAGGSAFCGEVLWPLFHGLPTECNFDRAYWQAFRRMSCKYARAVARAVAVSGGSDLVWVQDHPLINVALEMRRYGVQSPAAFFLHLPFPSPDLFMMLPWRDRLLAALLAYDRIGFQTTTDLANFIACVRTLAPWALLSRGAEGLWSVEIGRRQGQGQGHSHATEAGVFPVGIDSREVAARAESSAVAERAAALVAAHAGRQIVLGVDRLDRSKGIPEKLRAFADLLTRHPGLREKVSLVQVVVPARESLPRHAALREEIERGVGEINGRFGAPGWVPVHYVYRWLEPVELQAWYRAVDVLLVTPLKAGMELVAKEYCAARVRGDGVLVLSEFAGAAAQLGSGALLVNPYNVEATSRALFRALRMKPAERAARMSALRSEVQEHDVFWWADGFLAAALREPGNRMPGLRHSL
ncbi:MAG TPA: trehalose-6-phosphate synthase [Thermoanaerobaculia bacterium]|nr:trehalose-6-phosphate synthase [Thermoanaerobaculia bacterium]